MDESAFLAEFEACTLPFTEWTHGAHLTVAYLYLRAHPLDGAIERVRAGIRAYNATNEVPEGPHVGYHETLTQFWVRLMHAMIEVHGPGASAADFLERQPYLTQKLLARLFYSRPRMMSARAKREYLEPDLAPFPSPERGATFPSVGD